MSRGRPAPALPALPRPPPEDPPLPHATPLIATLVAGLGLAFVFAVIAHRLRLPLIAGYLAAGVLIGPFTPGYVADMEIATEFAELGVILLMFGVGLHFSLKDLLSVRAIAMPGALGQIAVATGAGALLGWALGWGWGAGILFGLALSVASTVVLLRALQERGLVETDRGRIAVGWLIVEDLVMVVALVLIPSLGGLLGGVAGDTAPTDVAGEVVAELAPVTMTAGGLGLTLLVTLAKVGVFVALMLVGGRRLIPWVLHRVAGMRSRELFRLAVLAIALGVAFGSSALFGVSFALGAFFAGLVMATSTFSQRAANETLPLRDAFAVLFFVSVGMLFDPMILVDAPFAVLGTVLIVLVVKSAAAYAIVRLAGHDAVTALTISAALAQIGEFSFILATLGLALEVLPPMAQDLIVAGAMISIVLNPFAFAALDRSLRRRESREAQAAAARAQAAEGRAARALAEGGPGIPEPLPLADPEPRP